MKTLIIEFDKQYREDFINLNKAWIEKYFDQKEEHDQETFENFENEILSNHGQVFFCLNEGKAIGTVAMFKYNDNCYELAKMAVKDEFQGYGISHLLIQACLNYAKKSKAGKIILFTNSILIQAINLYKKYGFIQVPVNQTKYKPSRVNIQMELIVAS
ncbi:MAG: GNAT family N-acetyltransferase [Saprospiraceae bacterium]|nr:GNAT family N-acetyltransferase [Saprospiraceae bacterium]